MASASTSPPHSAGVAQAASMRTAPLLSRHRAGPGAGPAEADRRALGHRHGRLSDSGASLPAGASGTTATATASRRFWRGDARPDAARWRRGFAGSADLFAATQRRPVARSVNFITAHDGFTLADLVSLRRISTTRRTARTTATARSANLQLEPRRGGSLRVILAINALRGPRTSARCWPPLLALARHADARHAATRMGPLPGRQQQRLCPGQCEMSWLDWTKADHGAGGLHAAALIGLARGATPALRMPMRFAHRPGAWTPAACPMSPWLRP
jgi:pullulanase/glycogen debranching enzyme